MSLVVMIVRVRGTIIVLRGQGGFCLPLGTERRVKEL